MPRGGRRPTGRALFFPEKRKKNRALPAIIKFEIFPLNKNEARPKEEEPGGVKEWV